MGGAGGRGGLELGGGWGRAEGEQTDSSLEKCDLDCPVMTPGQNATDKTHAERTRRRGRREEGDGGGDGGGRQAAEG